MATLETLVAYLSQLRLELGKDAPLYLVDNDFVEAQLPSSFKDRLQIGRPADLKTYKENLEKPVGLMLLLGD